MILIFIINFIVSLVVVRIVKTFSLKHNICSLPTPRKIHKKAIPLMGGLSFFFSVLFAAGLSIWMGILPVSIFSRHIYFFAGLLLIVVAGLADDIYRLNTLLKILTQSLAAVLLIIDGCLIQSLTGPFTGVFPLGNFAVPFTFFWILVIINAINLMDGLDGLAGGVGAIITVGFLATGLETGNALIIV
ncbi:MAG TPA: undecaprenyl/decaprenyl-phosphate alpha-N-acetylglucosaminyl 1-phosphate transferase, partial [Caldithrix sp.]|nr:undecaprenyl/decaprenyl-phosphate alpha-N-acetylglucosaminyl 1-phosphate transferase [Caldithrix sp.]